MKQDSLSRWLRGGYLALLALVLLSPFELRLELAFVLPRLHSALRPELAPADVVDAARNVLLFAGWGLLWVTTTDGRPGWRDGLYAAAAAAAVGVGAEAVQLTLPGRSPSILDVATNTVGGGAGALVALGVLSALGRRRDRPDPIGVPAAALALPYVAASFLEVAFPLLRQAGPPGRYGGPTGRIAWSLHHFDWGSLAVLPWLDFALLLPAGFLLGTALLEAGLDREARLLGTAAAGAVLSLVGELVHAPLGHPLELGPILLHVVAIATGGWLAATDAFSRWLRSSGRRGRALSFLGAYALILLLWGWRPFAPGLDPGRWWEQLGSVRWHPLGALGTGRTLVSVADVLRSFLLFAPVGAVLAVQPLRRSGPLRGLWPAVWTAGVLELGQAFLPDRLFDLTDPIVAFAGAGIAWLMVRRAGQVPRLQG